MSQPITIELPDPVLRQLMRIAEVTHQSLEALITQSVLNNLPPSPDNAPPEYQSALLALQTLSTEQLQAIAQAEVDSQQFARHELLLAQNAANQLSPAEREELTHLRHSADQLMLQKAYAWSILRWRGQKLNSPDAV
ncbi:MAG: hypothetical protein IGR76_10450 [Synechococcales cyanobacterium T60_A2020_003]|nr:hypothetical protein [Synechococcales cyanobacterium T60_A2020_003]